MKTIKHFIALLLCISFCTPLIQAQPAPDKQQEAQAANQDVLIIIQQEQVRFTAQKAVAEMQLHVFDQAGQLVYDSGAVTEPELTWVLRQANGETVKSGLYAYTLAVKEAGAADAKVRRGHFIVDRAKERDGQTDRLWITSQNDSGVGTELTVARNENVTIAGTSATTVKAGEKTQPEGEEAPKTKGERGESETKEASLALSVVQGKTTLQGGDDPLLEIDHTGPNGHPAIWFKQDGAPKAYMWWDQFNNSLRFGTHTANPVLTIANNGSVAIGTTQTLGVGLRVWHPFYGIRGETTVGTGVAGISAQGYGVSGSSTEGYGVYGYSKYNYAGYFIGDVHVTGRLSKSSGSFKIDHPLDPANKYLSHSFVESPDMMNIYNGNATTDAKGQAVVTMPSYFTALNRDYRYQLTVVGQFAQAMVLRKIKDNCFVIKTNKPHVEVSWQVTGIRQDAYAEAHRIRVEEEKTAPERGTYLNPEAFGQPQEKGVTHARHATRQQ